MLTWTNRNDSFTNNIQMTQMKKFSFSRSPLNHANLQNVCNETINCSTKELDCGYLSNVGSNNKSQLSDIMSLYANQLITVHSENGNSTRAYPERMASLSTQ